MHIGVSSLAQGTGTDSTAEITTKLDEIIITSKMPGVDHKIDRLVINLKNNITFSGNTILEVLQKSPGVVVNRQNNSISMNGRSGVRIMVNEKIVLLPIDAVMQMLDGMSASNIDKIELITTPPAKYDAEGNAGIIHIVTKEKTDLGTNVSLGLTAGARWAEVFGANGSLNHRGKKLAYFADYSILRSHNLHIMKMNRRMSHGDFDQSVKDNSRRKNITTQQNLNAGFEWRTGKNVVVNALFTGYKRNWDLHADATDVYRKSADSTVTTTMKIYESNIWQSATASLGVQADINAKSKITASADYLHYYNNNPSSYDINTTYEEQDKNEVSGVDLGKTTPIHMFVAKADYENNLSPTFSWETGVKGVASVLSNNVLVQRIVNDVSTTDAAFTSSSALHEQVMAGYISTKWLTERWQINGGLRYEYTHTSIGTPTEKDLINRKYGYLFPSVSAQKDLADEEDVRFSYSRRITRPTYNDIAPFVFLWGPNTFSAGNTSLYPSVVDAISASFHLKAWVASVQFGHSRREISFLQLETDDNGNLIFRSQNLRYMNTLALSNSYSIDVTPLWELQGNVTAQYQLAKSNHLSANETLHLFGANINIINQVRLPKNFSFEVSGMYQSKLISGISEYLPYGALNLGVQKDFKEKGILRISADDIFNTNNWRIRTYSVENGIDTFFKYKWNNRYVRVTYTMNIGDKKMKSVRVRSGSEEERRRVNE
jgi:hypothetical protein